MSITHGAVIYTDGGFNLPARLGGVGIHGYIYSTEVPKKGTGNPQAKPTQLGYQGKYNHHSTEQPMVTIVNYIEGSGPTYNVHSSGQVELVAVAQTLEYFSKELLPHAEVEITRLHILLDNEYVVKGFKQYLVRWKKAKYINSKGKPIQYQDMWMSCDQVITELESKGVKVDFDWIAGHSGEFGNTRADSLATLGKRIAERGGQYKYLRAYPTDKFWSQRYDFNPMIAMNRWYTSTNLSLVDTKPTHPDYVDGYMYYLGNHLAGFEDGDFGKPTADNANAVLYSKESDPVLTSLHNLAKVMDEREDGRIYIGRLDMILVPRNAVMLSEHGTDILQYWDNSHLHRRRDVTMSTNQDPLLLEHNPPGLAMKGLEDLSTLQGILDEYLNNAPYLVHTDITDQIYDISEKSCKIKKSLSGSRKLTIDARYCLKPSDGKVPDEKDVKTIELDMILRTDLPDRDSLKRLESIKPKIDLITWRLGDAWFKYAVVITTELGVMIWSAAFSNDILVKVPS